MSTKPFKIPFVDLKAQYNEIKSEVDLAMNNVLEHTRFINGEEVRSFEKKFANYLKVNEVVSVNSGTDALILGVRSLGFSEGEILVPSNSYISSALAATINGLTPVLVDIDENDFGFNLKDLRKKISSKTKAVIVVHLYGLPDKLDEIKKIIAEKNRSVKIIEDACQAHGAKYKGKRVGTFGIFGAFSFYPGKNLGAYGDGGAISTNSKTLASKLLLLKEYGQARKYYHSSLGVNSRLDTLQAAVLEKKLVHLDNWNIKRKAMAEYYTLSLKKTLPFVLTPKEFKERQSSWHIYCVRLPKRDLLQEYLASKGIETIIHYPIPIHMQKAYKDLAYKKGDFPHAEKIANEILSLPLYPEITKDKVDFVIASIRQFYNKI